MSTTAPTLSWSLAAGEVEEISRVSSWPFELTRDWAWGGATGAGVRVCVVDSGVDGEHELVGGVAEAVTVVKGGDGRLLVVKDEEGDACGHGTACASIVRSLAPECELGSVRVLGRENRGSGAALIRGLRWAIEEGYEVVNLSLSTTKRERAMILHELADDAYFRRTVLVASAHNMAVESFPWRFAAVVSVGSHEESDPLTFFYNPYPPVEFYARGIDVEVAWSGGGRIRSSGNSFATPHIAGLAALIRSKHPDLTAFELKSVLMLTASNVSANTP